MILSKDYILNKFYSNPFSSKSFVQRLPGVPGRNGVCLVPDWSFGCMVSGKTNWSVNFLLPSCIKSTTAQNLNNSNYARGLKKRQIRNMFLSFILPTPSNCSRDPAFVLFSIIGHFVFQIEYF